MTVIRGKGLDAAVGSLRMTPPHEGSAVPGTPLAARGLRTSLAISGLDLLHVPAIAAAGCPTASAVMGN